MVEGNPYSPQELATRENYREAFFKVMASRGLTQDSILFIKQANCVPILEAECDDEDGAIIIPHTLKTAFFAPYEGISSPEGDPQPVYVRNVMLGPSEGKIEIEPKLIEYTSGPKTEGFVTVAGAASGGRVVSSEITFDLDQGKYFVEVDRIDAQGRIIGQESIVEEHKLTPNMMDDLTSLLVNLNDRQRSRVSIYKNPPTPEG